MKKIYFGNIRFLHQKKLKLQDFLEQKIGYWLFKKWDTKSIKKFGISYTVNMYTIQYTYTFRYLCS